MKETASFVNERKREAENFARLIEIESTLVGDHTPIAKKKRRVVKEGTVLLLPGRKRCLLYLFSDMLLCCSLPNKQKKCKVIMQRKLNGMMMGNVSLSEDDEDLILSFKWQREQKPLQLEFPTSLAKQAWQTSVQEALDDLHNQDIAADIMLSSAWSKPEIPPEIAALKEQMTATAKISADDGREIRIPKLQIAFTPAGVSTDNLSPRVEKQSSLAPSNKAVKRKSGKFVSVFAKKEKDKRRSSGRIKLDSKQKNMLNKAVRASVRESNKRKSSESKRKSGVFHSLFGGN